MYDKKAILDKVIVELEKSLKTLVQVAHTARIEATHEEAKAENKYDTRGLEASYLAGAQAKRASELMSAIDSLKILQLRNYTDETPIEATALVEVQEEGSLCHWFFILPQQGGVSIEIEGQKVRTLSPSSPLGERLFGRTVGYFFELQKKGVNVEYEITQIW